MKVKKCTFGYIKYKRKTQGITTLIGLLIITAFVIAGIVIFGSKANYFTVIGALIALPVAKIAVNFFMFLPYEPASQELFDEVQEKAPNCLRNFDCIFTSKEKVMPAQAVVCTPDCVCAYSSFAKITAADFEKSVKEFLKEGKHPNVTVQYYRDIQQFYKRIEYLNANIELDNIEKIKERAGWVNDSLKAMCL